MMLIYTGILSDSILFDFISSIRSCISMTHMAMGTQSLYGYVFCLTGKDENQATNGSVLFTVAVSDHFEVSPSDSTMQFLQLAFAV